MKQLKPATFRREDDVEKFIEKCEKILKNFRSSTIDKVILFVYFLDEGLHTELC